MDEPRPTNEYNFDPDYLYHDRPNAQSLYGELRRLRSVLTRIANDYYHDRHAIWAKEALLNKEASSEESQPERG